jgi:glutathione reductase (NADPH)
MADPFDLIVLGAGSGGLAAAKRAASHGARVAIVEGDRVGGTCVIRGCVPKKLLVYGSAYRHLLADAASYGWQIGPVHHDPAVLLAAVRAEVDRLTRLHIGLLEKAGVELVRGWGRFSGPDSVAVTGADGQERQLTAARILIAVGGRPQRPEIQGAELAWVSDDMFLLERLPERVVVVGAGFIACEFAGILQGLGVKVIQLVRRDRLLRDFDGEAAESVREAMVEEGIDIRFGRRPVSITGSTPGDLVVALDDGDTIDCGGVLLATGRRPFLEGLNLEAAGIALR